MGFSVPLLQLVQRATRKRQQAKQEDDRQRDWGHGWIYTNRGQGKVRALAGLKCRLKRRNQVFACSAQPTWPVPCRQYQLRSGIYSHCAKY